MRKTIQKKVTFTNIQSARVKMEDGKPIADELPTEQVTGNIGEEKAQRIIKRMYGTDATVYGLEKESVVYEMPVEEFMHHATIKEQN